MLTDLPPSISKLPYSFFFGNLFTVVKLILFLKKNGYYGTRPIGGNRISKDIPFPNKKVANKMERGSTFSVLDKNNGI